MCLAQYFKNRPILAFSPTYSPRFFSKNVPKLTFDFITPFERGPFKLPEKQKNIVIGHSELELWPFKVESDCIFNWH